MAKLELDAGQGGWKCSECGQRFDVLGRPVCGKETWVIKTKGISWIENRPVINYCPGCGRKVSELNEKEN